LQLFGHAVERLDKDAYLAFGAQINARIKLALRYGTRRRRKRDDRMRDLSGDDDGDDDIGDDHTEIEDGKAETQAVGDDLLPPGFVNV